MQPGIHIHEPGRLSRWGVVDVGLRCMHSCKFCYYSFLDGSADQFAGMRHAEFLPDDHLTRLAATLAEQGFIGFDVTGGEPCLAPGIVALAREAKRTGLAMRVITLGQYLMRRMKSAPDHEFLIDGLIDAGVADFLLSVHDVDDDRFKALTGESWARLRAAMDYLDDRGFAYGSNTTVCAENFRHLPAIAEELASRNIYIANFILMNAYYAWSRPGADRSVQGHYGDIRPYLVEARDILEAAGIAVNIRYAPLCTMRGLERNLVGIAGVRHDPHEWMNAIEHMIPSSPEAMGQRLPLHDYRPHYPLTASAVPGMAAQRAGKLFPAGCIDCGAISVCDGVDRRYLAERGDGELNPYAEFRGDLLDRARIAYRAAFAVKTEAFADIGPVVRALLWGNHVAAA